MSRSVSIYVCQNCGAETRQFFGRCTSCGEWNSIIEEKISSIIRKNATKKSSFRHSSEQKRSEPITSVKKEVIQRMSSGYKEFDNVLGGGLVPGSLVLVGGDPGIGKSTLLLQSAAAMALKETILYVTAEESAEQVRLRWNRLQGSESNLHLLAETDLDAVIDELDSLKPQVAIIDSIQALQDCNLSSGAGSVTQVRECSAALQRIAKKRNIALIIVGHVTKEGILAGPKVLEHLVDAVLTFEGDRFASHRLLRAIKNRFGATNELAVFEMEGEGLIEVKNPSELFLSNEQANGVATIMTCEGARPLAIEIQALINTTSYPNPRRTATGVESNRLHQILAVIEKNMSLALSRHDCYLAVVGGINVEEPGADLGIATAIVSSFKSIQIPSGTILIGEIGLGGQLRPVRQIHQRIQEAMRLGFTRVIIPNESKVNIIKNNNKIKILKASKINEALKLAFNN